MALSKKVRITRAKLRRAGFVQTEPASPMDTEIWAKDGIVIWNCRDHWRVEALDYGGIEVEFRTMNHLRGFFGVCGKTLEW